MTHIVRALADHSLLQLYHQGYQQRRSLLTRTAPGIAPRRGLQGRLDDGVLDPAVQQQLGGLFPRLHKELERSPEVAKA